MPQPLPRCTKCHSKLDIKWAYCPICGKDKNTQTPKPTSTIKKCIVSVTRPEDIRFVIIKIINIAGNTYWGYIGESTIYKEDPSTFSTFKIIAEISNEPLLIKQPEESKEEEEDQHLGASDPNPDGPTEYR